MNVSSKLNQVVWILTLSVAMIVGCVAAIPVAVHYSSTDNKYVATAEVERNADELWQAVVRAAEKREVGSKGEMKILSKDSAARRLEASDGIQNASVEVVPIEVSKSKVIITADAPEDVGKEIDREKELAARIMKLLCEEAKADCNLVES